MNDYASTDRVNIKSASELAYRRGYADGTKFRARQFHALVILYIVLLAAFLALGILRYV